VLAVGVAGLVAVPLLHQPGPPRFVDRNLVVNWDGPTGASLPEMDRITSRVAANLRALPSVSDVAATLGRAVSADRIVDTSSGQIFVAIKGSADYGKALTAVRQVVQTVPGMHAAVTTYGATCRPVSGAEQRPDGARLARITASCAGSPLTCAAARAGRRLGASQIHLPTRRPTSRSRSTTQGTRRAPGDARRRHRARLGLTVGNFFQQQAVFDGRDRHPVGAGELDTMRDL
jgi:multidrug efflux pump subunit AcrB